MTSRFGLFALLAFALSGCGTCSGDNAGDSDAHTQTRAKKVLRFYRLAAYRSLDPVKQFDSAAADLLENVYDTLVSYHYLKRPYTLEPELLTKMPETSEDELVYSFELRKDVKFIDDPCFPNGKGRALTAADVIYSLHRFADANLNVQSYSLLQGMVAGMDEFREQTKQVKSPDYAKLSISGVKKIDDYHFTITLTRKNPLVLFPFASAMLSIVPREAVEHYKDDFEQHPVGTGPFRLKDGSRRGTLILERNPNYHGTYPTEGAAGDAEKGLLAAAGKRVPFLDEIHLPLIEEPQPAILKFQAGELDWVAIDRDNFVNMMERDGDGFRLKPGYAGKYELYWEPSLSTEYFVFNMADPLVGKNRALRQAFAYALDVPGYVATLRNGRGVAPTSMVPLPIAGSARDIPTPWYSYDPAQAKQKLAEAGFPGGKGLPPITIEYRATSTTVRHNHEYHRAKLAESGIVINANFQSFSAFLQRIDAANFQAMEYGWQADYPDAENFYALLYSANKAPGPNNGGYNNPEYDKLYEQIRVMPNSAERFALFERMNAIIREDVPVIPTWNLTVVGMRQVWLQNFKRNIMLDTPFRYLDIDSAKRARGVPK